MEQAAIVGPSVSRVRRGTDTCVSRSAVADRVTRRDAPDDATMCAIRRAGWSVSRGR